MEGLILSPLVTNAFYMLCGSFIGSAMQDRLHESTKDVKKPKQAWIRAAGVLLSGLALGGSVGLSLLNPLFGLSMMTGIGIKAIKDIAPSNTNKK